MINTEDLLGLDFIEEIQQRDNFTLLHFCAGLIVKELFALNFYQMAYWLGKCEAQSKKERPELVILSDSPAQRALQYGISQVSKECQFLGLRVSRAKAESLLKELVGNMCTFGKLSQGLNVLHERVFDELGAMVFFHLPNDRTKYFMTPWEAFGDRVTQKLPAITRDVEEAGKCFSMKRNTACVFHLMRIMEHGLRILGEQLGINIQAPSWDAILKKIDVNLQTRYQDKPADWISKEQYFSESASYLRSIKTAWRNPVMHVADHYSDEEAESIYQTVKVFMNHLAENMDKNPNIL